MTPSHQADLSLLAVSAVWGCSFTLVKISLEDSSPFLFLTLRFLAATLILMPWALPARRGEPRGRFLPGVLVGGFLFAGFTFQILGLRSITPANSAFVTALSVVLVPICVVPLRRRLPRPSSLIGVFLATLGLYFLLLESDGFQLSYGIFLTLLCALAFAFHIIGVDQFARQEPYRRFTLIQVSTAAALAGGATLLLEEPFARPTGRLLIALAITSILCTAGAFAIQNSMQRFTSPTRVAIVFATEPVFAALFSYFFYGEILWLWDLLGGGLIFAGMLAAEIPTGATGGISDPGNPPVNPPGVGAAAGHPGGHNRPRRC